METYESAPSSSQLQSAPPDLEVPTNLPELAETPNETAPQDSGDFYTPETGELMDFPVEEAWAEAEEELSPEVIAAIEQLEAAYPNLYRDASLTELAEASQENSLELLAQTRNELGLTESLEDADPESLQRMQETLEELLPSLEAAQVQVKAWEQVALELPEILQAQLEEVEEMNNQIKLELDAQMDEYLETASRLQRELAVRNFIKDSLSWMESRYGQVFERVENKKAAREIIAAKISSAIWEGAQAFIREGGSPDYGFHIEISITTHEDEEGEEKAYITEINIELRKATRAEGTWDEEEAA